MAGGAEFAHLHDLHSKQKRVRDQLERGPKQIEARKKKIAAAEAELAQKEQDLKDARAAADKKNLDLKSKENQILDLQGKLNTATTNREYDIIRGQIDADKAAMAVLEDEILELLERVDGIQREIGEAKQAVSDAEKDVSEFANQFEEKSKELSDQDSKLTEAIKDAERVIPGEIRDQYRRLVAAYGPDAMASAEGGSCNFCFVQLTSQNKVLLNSGKTLFCPSCGRLLYHDSE